MLGMTIHAWANPKYASIIIDANTGHVYSERYADKSLHPASLTKTMTLMLVFDAIQSGKTALNSRVKISSRAAAQVPSKLGLRAGSTLRVEDAIMSLVTKSANDIAVALAEHVAGSEANFVRMMNRKASEIGMTRTRFRNPSGLHNRYQVSTARDMAQMGRYLVANYPTQYKYFSRKNFKYNGQSYRNHNRLMTSYKGMDGIKTGYINASGFNLLASAKRGERRLVGVVFGGRTSHTRNAHMQVLLDRGFANARRQSLQIARLPIPQQKPAFGDDVSITVASVNPSLASKTVSRSVQQQLAQGDIDPKIAIKLDTSYLTLKAHRGELSRTTAKISGLAQDEYSKKSQQQRLSALVDKDAVRVKAASEENWAIQIGAFKSKIATDAALETALTLIPQDYKHAQKMVAPLRTAKSDWVFRARLTGFSKDQAQDVCVYFRHCLLIAP